MKTENENNNLKNRDMNIEKIISSLRNSDKYIESIFMQGGCYKFHLFLKTIYPNCKAYIHADKDHIATKIGSRFYDIKGLIDIKHEFLYQPLSIEDLEIARSWKFSGKNMLKIAECPVCSEPITI